MRKLDLVGQQFGRLSVVRREGKNKWGNYRWLCQCACGTLRSVAGSDLKSGSTQSCGCWNKDQIRKANTRHGYAPRGRQTRTYRTWYHMKERCHNENCDAYQNYGGRGISVCARWLKFENFLTDMGERPEDKTLDRIDNDGSYCPENCRWATWSEQQLNKRQKVVST